MEDKNITLHPTTETGAIDPETNLYPKTKVGNILGLLDYLKENLLELVFPVGSIYSSFNNVSPQTLLGGTWVRVEGKFLIGITESSQTDAAGKSYTIASGTGGYLDAILLNHTHSTTVSENGSHSHTFTGTEFSLDARHSHTFSLTADNAGSHTHGLDYVNADIIVQAMKKYTSTGISAAYDPTKVYNITVFNYVTNPSEREEYHSYYSEYSQKLQYTIQGKLYGNVNTNGTHYHTVSGAINNTSLVLKATPSGSISEDGLHSHTITMENPIGGVASGANRNLPPYQAVYMWRRTA